MLGRLSWLIAGVVVALLGCGGSKEAVKEVTDSTVGTLAGYGSVILNIQWPQGKSRIIPDATQTFVVQLDRGGRTLFKRSVDRSQTQVVFEKVPVGEWVLKATALGRFGEVLAEGSANFTLQANQNLTVSVELRETTPGAAVVVTGSGPTQVDVASPRIGDPVPSGVVSPFANLDTNNDGKLDTQVLVIQKGSAPLGFPGFSTTDNAVVVVQIRARQASPSVSVPINPNGALGRSVALPPGDYQVTVERVTIASGGNQLRIGEMTYQFSVFKDNAGNLHHTLPTFVNYRLPVVGQPVENVSLELTVDPAASGAGAKGSLFVSHANGSIELTNVSVGSDGKVSFQAQPGGPNLGAVSSVTVKVLLPLP
ncbi:MAG: hypothetical protein SLRJCFUN_001349 [Candidatus Fervidibacter sp.]